VPQTCAERVWAQKGRALASYAARKAAHDLHKLRGKSLVERIGKTRRYRVRRPDIRTLAALLILREQVIKPVLAGVSRPKRGRPPRIFIRSMSITKNFNLRCWPRYKH